MVCESCQTITIEKWKRQLEEGRCVRAVHGGNSTIRCAADESRLQLYEVVYF